MIFEENNITFNAVSHHLAMSVASRYRDYFYGNEITFFEWNPPSSYDRFYYYTLRSL